MTAVAFYISGHGFGHASRQIEIINRLAIRRPDLKILIRTTAASWLLDRTVKAAFDLDPQPVDTGVVQIDSLHLDVAKTMAKAREFYATFDRRVEEEAQGLVDRDVVFVVSDAPPLACAAAARAGIPSVVVSNFTWDWIYENYEGHEGSEGHDGETGFIGTIRKAYRQAEAAWRLPMHGGFATFKTIVDVPFVARHATHAPEETRRRLGLPSNRRLVLPTFGGYRVDGLKLDALDIDTPGSGWQVAQVPDAAIYDAGLRYEDLVRAVDVVLTKPGYGTLSECIANDTAVVYTSRGRFAEYDVLVGEMPKYLRCAYLDNESLLSGRWRSALDAALAAPQPPQHPRTDGAVIVADMICARVERRTATVDGSPRRRSTDARSDAQV